MKNRLLLILTYFMVGMAMIAQTTVWNPAANNPSDGLWSTDANWTNNAPVAGVKMVFNVADAMACTLNSTVTIGQFMMGDNGPGDTLIIASGGNLTTGAVWAGVGHNNTATVIVESNASLTFGEHAWIGHVAGGEGNIQVHGTVRVTAMTGLGWGGGKGMVTILDGGVFNCPQFNPVTSGAPSIAEGSYFNISGGTLKLTGDLVNVINAYKDAGRVLAYGGGGTLKVSFEGGNTLVTALADETAPSVLNISPADNATDVPAVMNILVEFSENMDIASVESAFSITPDIDNKVFSWNGSTLTVTGDDMASLQAYNVKVGTGAKDVNNNALENEYSSTFTTVDPSAPPVVVTTNPSEGATGVEMDASAIINFSKSMDSATVVDAISISPELSMESTFAWSNDYKTLTISGNKMVWETAYTLTIAAGAKAKDDTQLAADKMVNFTIKAQPLTDIRWSPTADSLWYNAANWSLNEVADGNYKVQFGLEKDSTNCILDTEVNINRFVLGDGGMGDTLIVVDGGTLNTRAEDWSAIGWDNTATLIVEKGGMVNAMHHLWIGQNAGANNNIYINGGTIHVGQMFGMDWNNAGNKDTLFLNSGVLSLSQIHESKSIGDNSQIVISGGMIQIVGNAVAALNTYIGAGKIIGFENAWFDGAANMTYIIGAASGTTVWNPANANDTLALFTNFMNWSDYNVPDSNKVVFSGPSLTSVLNDSLYINQLVMGDNGDADTLRVVNGGHLVTGAAWSAIGYNADATLVVDSGGMVTFGQHLWVGLEANADSKIIINEGGYLRCGQMFALDWTEKGNKDTVLVQGGVLDLFQIHETRSIGVNSQINITGGFVSIDGHNLSKLNPYLAANKIVAFGGEGTLDVVFDAPGNRTIIRAVPAAENTTVWVPANNLVASNKWTDRFNWSDKNAPNENKVVFNQNAITCTLDDSVNIKELVMGDGADADTLRIGDNGQLVAIADWSAVGYNAKATLVVDSGALATFSNHLWIGLNTGSDATLILNGGTVKVSGMFALDWLGSGNNDTVKVNGGVLDLFQLHETQSFGANSLLDITEGLVTIEGHSVTVVNNYITAGRIVAFGGARDVMVEFNAEQNKTLVYAAAIDNAVEKSTLPTLKVYPNPTSSVLNIQMLNAVDQVLISDIAGKTVYQATSVKGNELLQIDVAGFERGMYLVISKSDRTVFVDKVIVN